MNIHSKFFDFLNTLPNGAELQNAYRYYKDASFELNGKLKVGLPQDDYHTGLISSLLKIICAKSDSDLMLYRMTSRSEFIGPILSVKEDVPFVYNAFMSTTGDMNALHSFTPKIDPLVLKITCPAGCSMALMEAKSGSIEDEYLLGPGTKFSIGKFQTISCKNEASKYTGIKQYTGDLIILELNVVEEPPYAVKNSIFTF